MMSSYLVFLAGTCTPFHRALVGHTQVVVGNRDNVANLRCSGQSGARVPRVRR